MEFSALRVLSSIEPASYGAIKDRIEYRSLMAIGDWPPTDVEGIEALRARFAREAEQRVAFAAECAAAWQRLQRMRRSLEKQGMLSLVCASKSKKHGDVANVLLTLWAVSE